MAVQWNRGWPSLDARPPGPAEAPAGVTTERANEAFAGGEPAILLPDGVGAHAAVSEEVGRKRDISACADDGVTHDDAGEPSTDAMDSPAVDLAIPLTDVAEEPEDELRDASGGRAPGVQPAPAGWVVFDLASASVERLTTESATGTEVFVRVCGQAFVASDVSVRAWRQSDTANWRPPVALADHVLRLFSMSTAEMNGLLAALQRNQRIARGAAQTTSPPH